MKIFQSKRLPIPTVLTNQLFPFIYALSWSIYTHVYNFMFWFYYFVVVQSLTSCSTLCDLMDGGTTGFPVLHHLPKLVQTHVHWVSDAIQPSHPLSPSSPFAFNPSQHQGLLQWVGSLHQVAKILELQHQSSKWIFRVDFL